MAYKILKNHGALPREAELLKKIDAARQQLEQAPDDAQRHRCLQQLNELCLDYNALRPRHVDCEQDAAPAIKKTSG